MKVFGLVNIIRSSGPVESKGGGLAGLVLGGLAALVVLALGSAAYRALGAALDGVRDSTHAANVALAWCLGGLVLVAAVVGGAWLLIDRRREVRQRAQVEAFEARIEAARRAQALEASARRRRRLETPAPRAARVEAVRLDRLERGA